MCRQLFYWNTADNKNHTHQRIEWSQQNGYLVCIHINIPTYILDSIKVNDYILTYEPKYHKKSKYKNGDDGLCMSCNKNYNDGLQAFTNLFVVRDKVIVLNSIVDENNLNFTIFRNWLCYEKHCKDIVEFNKYFDEYYKGGENIYIIPIHFITKLNKPITVNHYKNGCYTYYGSIRKGFDKITDNTLLKKINFL